MSNANQKTLFQTWGSAVPQTLLNKDPGKKLPQKRRATPNSQVKVKKKDHATPSLWAEVGEVHPGSRQEQDMDEVDDDLILVAVYEAEKSLENRSDSSIKDSADVCSDLPGFDSSAGRIWIYPTNLPIRDYQLKISEAALFKNTLVSLPTGLGKTFIASVVMYNFYRWYPAGKIVFLAPTKPLVAQQIEACYRVMGIPQEHMAELTGSTPAPQRRELWRSRRVFFLTPQVMVNDLSRNTCPAPQIKCVVIDEAHKASGNHAYCQAVQQVISNLLISHIELRSEESPDVQAHSHQRSVEKIVVPLGDTLTGYQSRYLQVLERFTSRLTQMSVLNQRDLRSFTKYQIILAREQFRRNPPSNVTVAQHGALEGDFALCISLYHGYELLQQMGLRSLFFFTQNIMSGSKEHSRARNELQRSPVFMDLYREMEAMFLNCTKGPEEEYFYSHPKLQKLDEVIKQHFTTWAKRTGPGCATDSLDKAESTRVMIFSSFRDSVQEIAEMLNRHEPLVRVMTFMGQASAGKGVRGFTQKEQLEVVRRFREGGFNTLVSTCVGEEGLDIGEVDLIVCFDAQKSPIRLVQRMGRTGRHRQGRIVVILAEGREERIYNQSQSNRRSVNKCILGNKQSFSMFPNSPRMLPSGVSPTLHKVHVTCGQFETKDSGRRSGNVRQSLSIRRTSLLNPDAKGVQGCVKEDGFLTPDEEAEWLSTMKLGENEAQPRLGHSSLLCFNTEAQQQEECANGPVRELSLWEWRHWQNQRLPTHRVDHSSRCLHFTAVMDLIDQMRQEEEEKVGCRYESEIRAYLHKEDVVGCVDDGTIAKATCEKNPQMKRSRPVGGNTRCSVSKTNSDKKKARLSSWNLLKDKMSSESDCDDTTEDLSVLQGNNDDNDAMQTDVNEQFEPTLSKKDDSSHSSPEHTHSPKTNPDTSLEPLEEMFYLPRRDVCRNLYNINKSAESLEMILSNVKNLLSRSPPESFDLHFSLSLSDSVHFDKSKEIRSSPKEEVDHFQVNFNLGEDDNSLDSDSLDCNIAEAAPELEILSGENDSAGPDNAPNSPSWDEVFDDVVDDEADKNTCLPIESKIYPTTLDESVDLFGDDDAFFQISLPNIVTPNKDAVLSINGQETCVTENVKDSSDMFNAETSFKSPEHKSQSQKKPEAFNYSQDIFSVNFDLGFSFDSEDEETDGPASDLTAEPTADREHTFMSQTYNKPNTSSNSITLAHMSTPRLCAMDKKLSTLIAKSNLSPVITERESLQSKFSDIESPIRAPRKRVAQLNMSEESDDKTASDDDFEQNSVFRPRVFQSCNDSRPLKVKSKQAVHSAGRQFLDEEAELSEDGDSVSSDEREGEELDKSLEGFVVDATQLTQGLNDSEMHGIYLKSVKSPAVSSKFRMRYRPVNNTNIFSQVPEQDETYEEDSFVVNGSDVEEDSGSASDEDDEAVVEIVPEDSYIDGRRQYATRRRAHLKQLRTATETRSLQPKKNKRSRILRVEDSSEEDEQKDEKKSRMLSAEKTPFSDGAPGTVFNGLSRSYLPKSDPRQADGQKSRMDAMQHKQERFNNQALLSEQLDFQEPLPTSGLKTPAVCSTSLSVTHGSVTDDTMTNATPKTTPARVCVLVDSRCISASADVVSSLRLKHGAAVHICSLVSCDFIVSNRMAVEWQSESELANPQNRKRLQERIQGLHGLFERVCLLVVKDRTKPGEPPRVVQRTRYYNSTVAALVRAGVRLLFSTGADDTAALLAQLAQVEQRKGQAISVPVEVEGRRQQALQFYLTLPFVSYINALYMCNKFYSVAHLVNSSVDTLQAGIRVSRSRAEEIYRCLRYSCDTSLIKSSTSKNNL
ncbi:Fanconi anemia group M protein [Bagarius yarrelli]|uniref:Fanconi anemia group M protein n=1 Tax=Bagarius yarrelli TaxID=175774 RepID=A0A556UFC3_BAGYA|nr:Fanconi anemia group M protein [Bagarius yarrelli]